MQICYYKGYSYENWFNAFYMVQLKLMKVEGINISSEISLLISVLPFLHRDLRFIYFIAEIKLEIVFRNMINNNVKYSTIYYIAHGSCDKYIYIYMYNLYIHDSLSE